MVRCMSTCAVDKAISAHAVNHTLHAIHGKGRGGYLGCEGSKAACRGLTGSPSGLRNLSLGRQVCSGVRGVPLLAGEG